MYVRWFSSGAEIQTSIKSLDILLEASVEEPAVSFKPLNEWAPWEVQQKAEELARAPGARIEWI